MMGAVANKHDWRQVAIATERAKNIIARHFHVVGVLGKFIRWPYLVNTLSKEF